jgi:hypothetical protein
MNNLCNDPLLYDKLKSSSRKLITSRYEQKKVWNIILEEYKELENDLIYKNKIKKLYKRYLSFRLRQFNFSKYI